MNPTVKKRINLQVSQQQLKIHTGSTANFLMREDSSRDLLGKFHKDIYKETHKHKLIAHMNKQINKYDYL